MLKRESPAISGRGAQSAAVPSRFGLVAREADGDWLDEQQGIDGAPPPFRTTVTEEHPRTIQSFNQSPDIPFDRSVNAYRGCEQRPNLCVAFLEMGHGRELDDRTACA